MCRERSPKYEPYRQRKENATHRKNGCVNYMSNGIYMLGESRSPGYAQGDPAARTGYCTPSRAACNELRQRYFPLMIAIVYRSVSSRDPARRFTSESDTAAIFSGAEKVSSYPTPYNSLYTILSA
jgi:hypothetical protein